MSYSGDVRAHMGDYRLNVLGVKENGRWGDNEYAHILPSRLQDLNILKGFRSEFVDWHSSSGVKLHRGFHHLNSSQAACINLFFPPAWLGCNRIVCALLGIDNDDIDEWEFEKIIDEGENTNFDFYLQRKSGPKVYVEFKYSESGFGKAKDDESHRTKWQNIYRPKLEGKVASQYLETSEGCKNYQLLRNLVYFQAEHGDCVVFMYPKKNNELSFLPSRLDAMIPDRNIRKAVRIRYLEDAVDKATKALGPDDGALRNHFRQYEEKYLSLGAGGQ